MALSSCDTLYLKKNTLNADSSLLLHPPTHQLTHFDNSHTLLTRTEQVFCLFKTAHSECKCGCTPDERHNAGHLQLSLTAPHPSTMMTSDRQCPCRVSQSLLQRSVAADSSVLGQNHVSFVVCSGNGKGKAVTVRSVAARGTVEVHLHSF